VEGEKEMTDATAAKVRGLIGSSVGRVIADHSDVMLIIEEIVRIERCAVLKEAIDRLEKVDEEFGELPALMEMLDEEELK
jgi:hypothetical protein